MLNARLLFGVLATAFVAVHGQNSIDQGDIPQQCQQACLNVLNQAQTCNNQVGNNSNDNNGNNNNGDDQDYRQCFCNSGNMQIDLPNCYQCTLSYQNTNGIGNNNGDNDVDNWMNVCGFQNSPTGTLGNGPYGTTPYAGQGCSTQYYVQTGNNGDFNNNNGGYYTTRTSSVYCDYGAGGQTAWSTTTYTSVYSNNDGNLATSRYTSIIGTGINGQTTTVPTNYGTSIQPFYGAAATQQAALPYAGAGAAFMVAGFFL